jgi:hypothetical protein
MTEHEFKTEFDAALVRHSDAARAKILHLLETLPERATQLDFVVFPSQDGDGFFTIRASVEGPDLYLINRAIESHADLLDTKYTESGVEPPIPIVDPFDVEFAVNDLLVDCVARWLHHVWQSLGNVLCRVPVFVVGDDDFGSVTPLELHRGDVG